MDHKTWADVMAHEDTKLAPPAIEETIADFEAHSGFRLPAVHREFLLRGNGGLVGYARVFGIGRADDLDLGRHLSEMGPYIAGMADGPVLPFANDWGGGYFCYDLREPGDAGEYPVLYWNHEYSEEPDDRPMLWSKVAPNFLGFLQKVIA